MPASLHDRLCQLFRRATVAAMDKPALPAVRRRGTAVALLLLTIAACGRGDESFDANVATNANQLQEEKPGASAPAPAANPSPPAAAAAQARRCGWLHNPTPGNWWLTDRDGQWILATQGGRQVEGMDEIPDMSEEDWEETNGYYGYGCACLTLTVDPSTRAVIRLASPEPKPLKQCRADKRLPRP